MLSIKRFLYYVQKDDGIEWFIISNKNKWINSVTHCKSGFNKFLYFLGQQRPSQINISFPIPRIIQKRHRGFRDKSSPLFLSGIVTTAHMRDWLSLFVYDCCCYCILFKVIISYERRLKAAMLVLKKSAILKTFFS